MANKTISDAIALSLQSAPNSLKDFTLQEVKILVMSFLLGTDKYTVPLTYVQDGMPKATIEVDGVQIEHAVKGVAAKVYQITLEDGSRVWVDLFGLHTSLKSVYLTDAKPLTQEEEAKLIVQISDGIVRTPSVPVGATSFSYGTVTTLMSRNGRDTKVGSGSVGGSATKVKETKESLLAKLSEGKIDAVKYQSELALIS